MTTVVALNGTLAADSRMTNKQTKEVSDTRIKLVKPTRLIVANAAARFNADTHRLFHRHGDPIVTQASEQMCKSMGVTDELTEILKVTWVGFSGTSSAIVELGRLLCQTKEQWELGNLLNTLSNQLSHPEVSFICLLEDGSSIVFKPVHVKGAPCRLFRFEGIHHPKNKFAAIGSGANIANILLNLGIRCAKHLVHAVSKLDTGTGGAVAYGTYQSPKLKTFTKINEHVVKQATLKFSTFLNKEG
jgi:hypothetical protein